MRDVDLAVWLIFLIYLLVNFFSCIGKTMLTQFAVPEQLSRLIVSTGFLDHDPIDHRGTFGIGCTGFWK